MGSPLYNRGFRIGEAGGDLPAGSKTSFRKGWAAGRRKAGHGAPAVTAPASARPHGPAAAQIGPAERPPAFDLEETVARPAAADEVPLVAAPEEAASASDDPAVAADDRPAADDDDAASSATDKEARHAVHAAKLPVEHPIGDVGGAICVHHASVGRPCAVIEKDGTRCRRSAHAGMARATADDLANGTLTTIASILKAFEIVPDDFQVEAHESESLGAMIASTAARWGFPSNNSAGIALGGVGVVGFGVRVGAAVRAKRRGLDFRPTTPAPEEPTDATKT